MTLSAKTYPFRAASSDCDARAATRAYAYRLQDEEHVLSLSLPETHPTFLRLKEHLLRQGARDFRSVDPVTFAPTASARQTRSRRARQIKAELQRVDAAAVRSLRALLCLCADEEADEDRRQLRSLEQQARALRRELAALEKKPGTGDETPYARRLRRE